MQPPYLFDTPNTLTWQGSYEDTHKDIDSLKLKNGNTIVAFVSNDLVTAECDLSASPVKIIKELNLEPTSQINHKKVKIM